MKIDKPNAGGAKPPQQSKGAKAPPPVMPAVPAPPTHLNVAREMKAKADHEAAERQREATVAKLLEEDQDGSDIMFAPGRADLLCGVQPDPNFHYLVCGEDTTRTGTARVNLHKFLGAGYQIAKLPDGKPADFPEIMRAILCVPRAKYERYRRHLRLMVAEANGLAGGPAPVESSSSSKTPPGPIVYDETMVRGMASPSDLGILPPGVSAS